MMHYRIGICILSMLCMGTLFAQQQDAVGTFAINLEKKLSRTVSITAFNQYGFTENMREPGYMLLDGGIQLKLNSSWSLGMNYRTALVRSLSNQYDPRQFLYGDINYTRGFGNFTFNVRSRYVVKTYGYYLSDADAYRDNKHYLRNRGLLRYEFNYHHDVFGAYENVYRLDQRNETELHRYTLGYAYTINNFNKVQLTYTIAPQANRAEPDTDFITGVSYFFKF